MATPPTVWTSPRTPARSSPITSALLKERTRDARANASGDAKWLMRYVLHNPDEYRWTIEPYKICVFLQLIAWSDDPDSSVYQAGLDIQGDDGPTPTLRQLRALASDDRVDYVAICTSYEVVDRAGRNVNGNESRVWATTSHDLWRRGQQIGSAPRTPEGT